jgi:hypothetical protein
VVRQGRAVAAAQPAHEGRLDGGRDPVGAQGARQPAARADHRPRRGVLRDADEHALARRPRALRVAQLALLLHVGVDAVGRAAQGQLAQRDQVRLAEEVLRGALGLAGDVDLALAQALEQLGHGQVDELDLVGAVEDVVGQRLAHDDAGDLRHDVVQALEVLHVQRGSRRRCRRPAGPRRPASAWRAASRGVRVGQLVDQQELRCARERGVHVELAQRDAAILDLPRRDLHQPRSSASVSRRPCGSM